MRIRYGKPIKVKNVSDVTESFSISSSNALLSGCGGQYVTSEHKSYLYQQMASRVGHKIFMLYKLNSATLPPIADVRRLIVVRGDGSSVICYTNGTADTYKTGNDYYGNMTVSTGTTTNPETADTWLQLNSGKTFDTGTSYSWFIIDLTEAFGSRNEPTAQQFYDKYNKYFPLIATGEEITIDDKAGQVSLFPRLPSIYQEVEYIQSDGNQYLSLDVGSFNANFKLDIDFQQTSSSTSELCLFGNSGLEVFTRSEGFGYWTSSNGSSFATNYASLRGQRVFASIDNSNGKMQVNSVVTTYTPKTVSSYTSINVFRYAYSDRYLFVGRIFYLKLYTGNKYIELIPCYRKSDNVIGMYDLVGKQFYVNQGTGTFLKGPNVATIISCKVAGGSSDIYYGYNQLVNNGNFTDSSDWSNTDGTTKAVSDNIMTLTATSLGKYDFAIYQNIGNLKANDKYIILFDAKTNSSSNKTINIYLTAGYVSQNETLLPNVWNSIGKIFSYDADKVDVIAYFGKIGDLPGWANGDIIYFKNINIINLTE